MMNTLTIDMYYCGFGGFWIDALIVMSSILFVVCFILQVLCILTVKYAD